MLVSRTGAGRQPASVSTPQEIRTLRRPEQEDQWTSSSGRLDMPMSLEEKIFLIFLNWANKNGRETEAASNDLTAALEAFSETGDTDVLQDILPENIFEKFGTIQTAVLMGQSLYLSELNKARGVGMTMYREIFRSLNDTTKNVIRSIKES